MKTNFVSTVKNMFNSISVFGRKHAPIIFTGLGIAGMGATAVLVHKTSPKFHDEIAAHPDMSKREKAMVAAKLYWPAAVSFGTSTALILGGAKISSKRNLALAASASLAQKELLDWKEASLEKLGENTVDEIRQKVAENRVIKADANDVQILNSDNGKDLFYEPITGHMFYFDKEKLLTVENEANSKLLAYDQISLAQVYSELGIPDTQVSQSLFFNIYEGKNGFVKFITTPVQFNGKLCWELTFEKNPEGDFPFLW